MIPRLWYVTDGVRGTAGRAQAWVIEQAFRGGAGAVLLREPARSGRSWQQLLEQLRPARRSGLRVVASRRLDLARALELDGVHLAADAVPVRDARAWLGSGRWIGYSAHSIEEAARAVDEGADYVTLSPIHATASKPSARPLGLDTLARAAAQVPAPVLALGGVTPDRTRGILEAGAWGLAVVSAIGGAADVAGAAHAFTESLAGRAPCTAAS